MSYYGSGMFTRQEQIAAVQEELDRLEAMTEEEFDAECVGEGFDPDEIKSLASALVAAAREAS